MSPGLQVGGHEITPAHAAAAGVAPHLHGRAGEEQFWGGGELGLV